MEIITQDSEKLKNEIISIKNGFKFQLKMSKGSEKKI